MIFCGPVTALISLLSGREQTAQLLRGWVCMAPIPFFVVVITTSSELLRNSLSFCQFAVTVAVHPHRDAAPLDGGECRRVGGNIGNTADQLVV